MGRYLTDHMATSNEQVQIEVLDEPGPGGANHAYEMNGFDHKDHPSGHHTDLRLGQVILFQHGPLVCGSANGTTIEALIAICIDRLNGFQSGEYPCTYNDQALVHFNAGLQCLHDRTRDRIERGVEGKHEA